MRLVTIRSEDRRCATRRSRWMPSRLSVGQGRIVRRQRRGADLVAWPGHRQAVDTGGACAFSSAAHASSVAPVVQTSSTRTMRKSVTLPAQRNAPAMLAWRSFAAQADLGPGPHGCGRARRARAGTPTARAQLRGPARPTGCTRARASRFGCSGTGTMRSASSRRRRHVAASQSLSGPARSATPFVLERVDCLADRVGEDGGGEDARRAAKRARRTAGQSRPDWQGSPAAEAAADRDRSEPGGGTGRRRARPAGRTRALGRIKQVEEARGRGPRAQPAGRSRAGCAPRGRGSHRWAYGLPGHRQSSGGPRTVPVPY